MRRLAIGSTVIFSLACMGGKGGDDEDEGQLVNGCTDGVDNDGDGDFDCDDASCDGAPTCAGEGETGDTDTNGGPPSISYGWDSSGLTVEITNLPGTGFELGLAETTQGDMGWYGEDCFNGTGGYGYCHRFDGSVGVLAALSSRDRDPENVIEGETTLFSEDLAMSGDSDKLAYMVTFDDGSCMTWGSGTDYYASFDCDAL